MRERIIAEIRRLAADNGGVPPGRGTFEGATGIVRSQWYGLYWARWGDALVEAGFAANDFTARSDSEFLLSKLAEAYRHYGRVATHGELRLYRQRDPAFPWTQTLDNNFGTKPAMIEALRDWLTGREEYADIAAILPIGAAPKAVRRGRAKDGSVYLIKSGPHYKIGRSDELERRVKEIRIALPDAATLEHAITTDDPSGIEAYWHKRFSDKRRNGEWFRLDIQDVAVFRKRKFQ